MPKLLATPCLVLVMLLVGCLREEVYLCDGPDYAWECTCPDAQEDLREFDYYDNRCEVCQGENPDPKCADRPPPKLDAGKDASGGQGGSVAAKDGGADAASSIDASTDAGQSTMLEDGGPDAADQCTETCEGSTPHCDTATKACEVCVDHAHCSAGDKNRCVDHTCVECEAASEATDCTDGDETHCVDNTCVECRAGESTDCASNELCDEGVCVDCLQTSDCESPTAPICNIGSHDCTGCVEDTDCTRFPTKQACAKSGPRQGQCVECTVAREDLCGGKVCVPTSETCSATLNVDSLLVNKVCAWDSECPDGDLPLAQRTHRCVPVEWQAAFRNNYCLKIKVEPPNCDKPHSTVLVGRTSTSGVAGASYCSVNEEVTTFEAVAKYETACPCPDGGQCVQLGATPNACSYNCATTLECIGDATCDPAAVPYCKH